MPGDTGVIIKVVQKEDQVKKYANYLSAQLTAMFGDLKDKHVLWIGTSIPAETPIVLRLAKISRTHTGHYEMPHDEQKQGRFLPPQVWFL